MTCKMQERLQETEERHHTLARFFKYNSCPRDFLKSELATTLSERNLICTASIYTKKTYTSYKIVVGLIPYKAKEGKTFRFKSHHL